MVERIPIIVTTKRRYETALKQLDAHEKIVRDTLSEHELGT